MVLVTLFSMNINSVHWATWKFLNATEFYFSLVFCGYHHRISNRITRTLIGLSYDLFHSLKKYNCGYLVKTLGYIKWATVTTTKRKRNCVVLRRIYARCLSPVWSIYSVLLGITVSKFSSWSAFSSFLILTGAWNKRDYKLFSIA